jgi:hypothetical protein
MFLKRKWDSSGPSFVAFRSRRFVLPVSDDVSEFFWRERFHVSHSFGARVTPVSNHVMSV